MRGGWLLLVALFAAGCVNLAEPPSRAVPQGALPLQVAPPPLELALDAAPAVAAPAFDLSLSDVWLRPYQAMNASVNASGRVAWYAGIPGTPVRVTTIAGQSYLGRDLLHNRSFGTDLLAPQRAQGLRISEGRYVFTSHFAPEMRATITARADAASDEARVFLVGGGDAGAYRFVPDALAVRPGGVVAFVNKANATLDVVEREFLARVPGDASRVEMHPVELGVYDLVAVVDDAGEARGRFLVDFDRPPSHADLPVLEGEFLGALNESRSAAYNASLPIRAVTLDVAAASRLPDVAAPSSIRVRLAHEGHFLVDAVVTGARSIRLEDLPPGELVLTLAPEGGAWTAYRATGAIDMTLPVPDALR